MTIAEFIDSHQAARVARAKQARKARRRRDVYTRLLMDTVALEDEHAKHWAAPLNRGN